MFSGTQDKCKICDKPVYVVDMVTANGTPYHKNCFRCTQCDGKLVMGRFSIWDEDLYCMPHYEQKFRETGCIPKKLAGKPELTKTPSKLSHLFSGTTDKCATCKKTVYPLEKIIVEGENYHKSCFRCAKGGCFLTTSNYAALDGFLYCKPHFSQLFKEKGSYSYLTKSISSIKDVDVTTILKDDKSEIPVESEPKVEENRVLEE